MWVIDPFGKMKDNLKLTMIWLFVSPKNGKVTYEELKVGLRKVGSQLAEPEIKMLMEVVGFLNIIPFIMYLLNIISLLWFSLHLLDNQMEPFETIFCSMISWNSMQFYDEHEYMMSWCCTLQEWIKIECNRELDEIEWYVLSCYYMDI